MLGEQVSILLFSINPIFHSLIIINISRETTIDHRNTMKVSD